ncbi:MAG: LysR family transcriptional regulator [Acidimicrobiales bacterium]
MAGGSTEFTLRQARYFLVAAETGSMAAAARQLHVSASAVSQAISSLERILGSSLLVRAPHQPLALTAGGARLIGDLRRLVDAADELVNDAQREADQVVGQIRLGCYMTLAPTYVPRLVAANEQAHPGIDIRVSELSMSDLQDQLFDGRLELGLLYDRHIRPGIATETVTVIRPHVLVWATHPLADRKSVNLRELAVDPIVMLDVPPSRNYFEELLEQLDIQPPATRITGSFETVRSLVARGLGWSILIQRPDIDISYEGRPIRTLEIDDQVRAVPVVAAWPANARLPRRVEAVLEMIRQLS